MTCFIDQAPESPVSQPAYFLGIMFHRESTEVEREVGIQAN